jgi:hypothetical protein
VKLWGTLKVCGCADRVKTCVEIRVSHDRRDNKDGHARIIIMRPGDDSPLEAEYIFADCFSSNPILLALGRRTIHISTVILQADLIRSVFISQTQSQIVRII